MGLAVHLTFLVVSAGVLGDGTRGSSDDRHASVIELGRFAGYVVGVGATNETGMAHPDAGDGGSDGHGGSRRRMDDAPYGSPKRVPSIAARRCAAGTPPSQEGPVGGLGSHAFAAEGHGDQKGRTRI